MLRLMCAGPLAAGVALRGLVGSRRFVSGLPADVPASTATRQTAKHLGAIRGVSLRRGTVTDPAPEGSDKRRRARMLLLEHARNAREQGCSFDGWCERENQSLIDMVTQRDLDSIFHLTWARKRRRP